MAGTLKPAVEAPIERAIERAATQSLLPAISMDMERAFALQAARPLPVPFSTVEQQQALASAVSASLLPTVKSTFETVFRDSLIPAFERGTQEMFRQVQAALERGTRECTLRAVRCTRAGRADAVACVSVPVFARAHVPAAASADASAVSAMTELLNTSLSKLRVELLQELPKAAASAAAAALAAGAVPASALVPASASPAPSPSMESRTQRWGQISTAIVRGDYATAFADALAARDLDMLIRLCRTVSPEKVFSAPDLIPQTTALSLIQQLGFDLREHVDVKISFLSDAILYLNPHDPNIMQHAAQVLQAVRAKVKAVTGVSDALMASVRRLLRQIGLLLRDA